MYAVVGCGDCEALWIVEGSPETTQCPRCGKSRKHALRKAFARFDDADAAREARAALLADRQDAGEAFEELPTVAELEERLDEAGPSDETYLDGVGLDADEIAAAGDRAGTGGSGGSTSARETVLDGLRELDRPTESALVDYCEDRSVDPEYVRDALGKLVRRGRVSEHDGRYRLL